LKTDLKINYAVLEDIADNVNLYKTAIEDIDDSIGELSKVIEKQKSESTKKLASKISKKKDKRSDLIKKLDEIQKMIQNYCADMRSLVNCKQEQKNTRVDQLDVQFNVWQIKTSIFSFVCDMTSEPQESNLPIQVGPNCDPHREEKEKKMQANYKKLMNFYRNRIVPTYKEIDEYTDDFKKIYDKFVAPYENKDDEYASKMGKIYDKGKSWLQKAEDWFHNHKDAIGVFFTEFAKGFVGAVVVVVIAGALSIPAGILFAVLMIAVPLGKSAVAFIPDGAFDYPLLKDFKKSCNETKDSVGKLCSITLDRGPMGFVECIGQGMEDNVQTDKGIAAIFGSVSGMALGTFAGGELVESIRELKVTKSELEIAKLEKPKVKEAKPKDIGGEKPGVNTLIPKDVKDIIAKVENGTIKLVKNIQKGNYGEMKMDVYFAKRGYKRISLDRVTSIDAPTHHGIDGVYYNPEGKPPYVIAEAKFSSTGIPRLSKLRDGTRQMSEKWITKQSKRGLSRLDQAVGKEKALDILTKDYKSVLVTIDKTGDVKTCILDANGKMIK